MKVILWRPGVLLNALDEWNRCRCGSSKLIYGYRMFKGDTLIQIETECEECGVISMKHVNGEEYEKILAMEKKKKEGVAK